MSNNAINSKKQSGFSEWWNSPKGKKVINAIYSVGAGVVIIGAMFKILHLPGANVVLGTGMICEAFIFSLGAFDKPFKEYHWDRVFDFENGTGSIVRLADWDTMISNVFAKRVIRYLLNCENDRLPKETMFAFDMYE